MLEALQQTPQGLKDQIRSLAPLLQPVVVLVVLVRLVEKPVVLEGLVAVLLKAGQEEQAILQTHHHHKETTEVTEDLHQVVVAVRQVLQEVPEVGIMVVMAVMVRPHQLQEVL